MRLPPFRTEQYIIFRVCEKFHLNPPGVDSQNWDELLPWIQAMLIAFTQIRDHEDNEQASSMLNAMVR